MLTYGDGVSDINLHELINFHKSHGKIATLTSINNPSRFGNVQIEENGNVREFHEKPDGNDSWINGGFFVLEPDIFRYLQGDVDNVQWEKGPLIQIAKDGLLAAYKHHGFWMAMDAMRDRLELEAHWKSGNAKWKLWEN